MEDELRDEYDLKSLKVRKMGAKRKSFGNKIIKLDTDVEVEYTKLGFHNPTFSDKILNILQLFHR